MRPVDFSTPVYVIGRRFSGAGFVHYRSHPGGLLVEKPPAPRGGVTIRYVREGTYLRVGVAVCSPLDNFSRARGRTIAQGRLETAPRFLHLTDDSEEKIWAQLDDLAWDLWARAHDHRGPAPALIHHRRGEMITVLRF